MSKKILIEKLLECWSSQHVEQKQGWESPKDNEKIWIGTWQSSFEAIQNMEEQSKFEKLFREKLKLDK